MTLKYISQKNKMVIVWTQYLTVLWRFRIALELCTLNLPLWPIKINKSYMIIIFNWTLINMATAKISEVISDNWEVVKIYVLTFSQRDNTTIITTTRPEASLEHSQLQVARFSSIITYLSVRPSAQESRRLTHCILRFKSYYSINKTSLCIRKQTSGALPGLLITVMQTPVLVLPSCNLWFRLCFRLKFSVRCVHTKFDNA
jgi:hypothetical protein